MCTPRGPKSVRVHDYVLGRGIRGRKAGRVREKKHTLHEKSFTRKMQRLDCPADSQCQPATTLSHIMRKCVASLTEDLRRPTCEAVSCSRHRRRQPSPAWQEKASIVDRVRGRDKVGNDLPMKSVSLTDVRSLSTPGAGVYRREIVDASGSSEFSLSINRLESIVSHDCV